MPFIVKRYFRPAPSNEAMASFAEFKAELEGAIGVPVTMHRAKLANENDPARIAAIAAAEENLARLLDLAARQMPVLNAIGTAIIDLTAPHSAEKQPTVVVLNLDDDGRRIQAMIAYANADGRAETVVTGRSAANKKVLPGMANGFAEQLRASPVDLDGLAFTASFSAYRN